MSYPGPVGYVTNLGCDTGNQRAVDQFNFVLDNGGAAPTPSTPSNLQSPAAVLPDTNGAVNLNLVASTGSGNASLTVASSTGNLATIAIGTSAGGLSSLLMGQTGTPNAAVRITALADGSGEVKIQNATSGSTVAAFNTTTNTVDITNPLVPGNVYLNNTTTVTSSGTRPAPSGIVLTPTSNVNSNIGLACASGGALILGSSVACPATLVVQDTTGADSAFVGVVGSGTGGPIRLQGASAALNTPIIANNNVGPATLCLGSSATNPQTVFLTDPTGVADAAFVDITGGTSATRALRLQGCRPGQNTATVSTNFATGGGGQLNLTSGYNDGQAKIEIADNSITFGRVPSAAAPGWAPVLLYGPQATGPGTINVDCSTLPSGWCVVYGVSSSGANPLSPGDRASMFNTILYSGPGNVITAGGLGGVPAYCTTLPSATNNTSLDVNFASATSASYAIYGMALIGG